MIQVTFAVKIGPHTRGDVLELEELDADGLARVEDLVHEMRAYLEQHARIRRAKQDKENGT
jgi:hypothetical protein